MKIKTDELRAAFNTVDYVSVTPVMESSQFVRLRQNGTELLLTMTGMLWAEARVKTLSEGGKWTAFVDRRALGAFLSTAKSPEMEVFYKDKLTLRADQRLEIALHAPISGYETWACKTHFTFSDEHRRALKTAAHYTPTLSGFNHLEAVYFGKSYGMLVTDSRTIMAVLIGNGISSDFFVPKDLITIVGRGNPALDTNGMGAVMPNGFVYQPLSSSFVNFPIDQCKGHVESARKAAACLKMRADTLKAALEVAGQFILDKTEAVQVENAPGGGLLLTVEMASSKFQRTVTVVGTSKLPAPGSAWPVKRLLPWLDYAVESKKDCEIEFAKMSGLGAFRFVDDTKHHHLLLFSDL